MLAVGAKFAAVVVDVLLHDPRTNPVAIDRVVGLRNAGVTVEFDVVPSRLKPSSHSLSAACFPDL